jgi:hypothetical protein
MSNNTGSAAGAGGQGTGAEVTSTPAAQAQESGQSQDQPPTKKKSFCDAIGINVESPNTPGEQPPNGVYRRALDGERNIKRQYYFCATLLNTCLLLQVAFGVTLTALSVSKVPQVVITVIAALNTAAAGILTYLKGQGLPIRLVQYQNDLSSVREEIEDQYRDFDGEPNDLDVRARVIALRKKYRDAKTNAERNYPGFYRDEPDQHEGTGPGGSPTA